MPNIHQRIADMTDLAKTYAEDGAFHTAANRLRELADEIDAHITALTDAGDPAYITRDDAEREAIEQAAMRSEVFSRVIPPGKVQQRAVRKADAERKEDRYFPVSGVDRVYREANGWRTRPDGSMFKPGS